MSTNFADVNQISLGSSQYGIDLNDRLETIDDNFKLLVNGSFLKGDKGDGIRVDSVGITNEISEYYLNGTQVNLWGKISEAIHRNHQSDNNGGWNTALEDMIIQVLYTEVMREGGIEKHIQSIFPFTYMDPRFVDMEYATEETHGNWIDHSCTVAMRSTVTGNTTTNEFVSYQNAPTIFWNPDVKSFCWRINGNQTDIICQGPSGKDGQPGSSYIVYVDKKKEELNDVYVRKILCVLGWKRSSEAENGYEYGQILPADFEKFNIHLETGLCTIAFPAYEDGNQITRDYDLVDGKYVYYFSQVLKQTSDTGDSYYVYAGNDELCPSQMLLQNNLRDLLNGIGSLDDPESVKGLYIRTGTDGVNTTGHMLWNDEGNLHMAHTMNVDEPTPDNDYGRELHLDYRRTYAEQLRPISIRNQDEQNIKILSTNDVLIEGEKVEVGSTDVTVNTPTINLLSDQVDISSDVCYACEFDAYFDVVGLSINKMQIGTTTVTGGYSRKELLFEQLDNGEIKSLNLSFVTPVRFVEANSSNVSGGYLNILSEINDQYKDILKKYTVYCTFFSSGDHTIIIPWGYFDDIDTWIKITKHTTPAGFLQKLYGKESVQIMFENTVCFYMYGGILNNAVVQNGKTYLNITDMRMQSTFSATFSNPGVAKGTLKYGGLTNSNDSRGKFVWYFDAEGFYGDYGLISPSDLYLNSSKIRNVGLPLYQTEIAGTHPIIKHLVYTNFFPIDGTVRRTDDINFYGKKIKVENNQWYREYVHTPIKVWKRGSEDAPDYKIDLPNISLIEDTKCLAVHTNSYVHKSKELEFDCETIKMNAESRLKLDDSITLFQHNHTPLDTKINIRVPLGQSSDVGIFAIPSKPSITDATLQLYTHKGGHDYYVLPRSVVFPSNMDAINVYLLEEVTDFDNVTIQATWSDSAKGTSGTVEVPGTVLSIIGIVRLNGGDDPLGGYKDTTTVIYSKDTGFINPRCVTVSRPGDVDTPTWIQSVSLKVQVQYTLSNAQKPVGSLWSSTGRLLFPDDGGVSVECLGWKEGLTPKTLIKMTPNAENSVGEIIIQTPMYAWNSGSAEKEVDINNYNLNGNVDSLQVQYNTIRLNPEGISMLCGRTNVVDSSLISKMMLDIADLQERVAKLEK